MSDIKLKWPGKKPPEEEKESKDWFSHINPLIGMEHAFSLIGAAITQPWRANWGDYLSQSGISPEELKSIQEKGVLGAEAERQAKFVGEYEEWKGSPEEPHTWAPVPSWKQWGSWLGLGEEPTEEEMNKWGFAPARLGMGEVAEIAPLMFMGGGVAGAMPKAGETLQASKGLFGLKAPPVQAVTKKQAERLLQNQLARGEEPTKELIEKVAPEINRLQLGVGVSTKPSFEVSLAQTSKTLLPREVQTFLGKREINKGLSDIENQIAKLETLLKPTPRDTKRLNRLKAIRTQLQDVSTPKGVTYLPKESLSTNAQKITAHNVAAERGLMKSPKEVSDSYRKLAKVVTGKNSMMKMTESEAESFISALESVVVKGGGKIKIPVSKGVITQEFADKIPMLNEIGVLERVRPTRQVFEKMGLRKEIWEPAFEAENKMYLALMKFRKEITQVKSLVKPESRPRIFQAIEHPTKATDLTNEEKLVYKWFKNYFDDWANKLKLPAEKRRDNYVTHIFEKSIAEDLAAKHPLDPELIRAMDFASPKTVFNPYLKARLGQTMGLVEDPFLAASAYESRALRVFHYQPLLQRIGVYEKYLPPNSARYLRDFKTRITNRPLAVDREINQSLKEFAESIKGLPGGEKLAAQLTKGNAGGLAAYNYTSFLYFSWLGFKPTSAIRNLSQHVLAMADVGPLNLAKAFRLRLTTEGKAALEKSAVLTSRKQAYMPGIDTSFSSRWMDNIRETSLKMFRWADRQNVQDAFLSGYSEAKSFGLSEEWAIKRGDEVAANTQYLYTRLAGAQWSQSTLGRVLSPLTTWPENWLELMAKWFGGKPSYVYTEYAAATGKSIPEVMSWGLRRKSLAIYLPLVAGAYAIEQKTKFRASEYTGWGSIRYLMDIASGQLPALDLPSGLAQVVGGAITGNENILKSGWNRVRPDHLMGIVNQLRRVADGKTDWLSLFIYLNPDNGGEEKESPYAPSGGTPYGGGGSPYGGGGSPYGGGGSPYSP